MSFDITNEKNITKTLFLRQLKKDDRVTVRGISMEQTYYEGDIVCAEVCDTYDIGDVVIAIDDPCRVLIHRVFDIEFDENGNRIYCLKGDNTDLKEHIPEKYCLARVKK